jgi:uncharacterized protein involved in exopolysaccharide biosynthesis
MQPSPESVSIPRRPLDIEDYVDILRRHWGWILGPLFAGLVIGVTAAFLWPDTYLSWATLRIVPPQVPERVIPSNFNRQMAERLEGIYQKVTNRDGLIGIIQRQDLYPSERKRKPMEDIWTEMRKNVRVVGLGPQQDNRTTSYVFQISFRYRDRQGTVKALEDLTRQLRDTTVRERQDASEQTRRFLTTQQEAAARELQAIEERRTKFRAANIGRLPEEMQANFQAIQALQMQLSSVNEAINRAGQEKLMLETQLQNVKDQIKSAGSTQDDAGNVVKNERLIQLNKAILDMETSISALRETYKEDHPDIRSAKARLEVLRRERDRMTAEEEKAASSQQPKKVLTPVAAKALRDLEMVRRNIESRIQVTNLDMEERTKTQKRLTDQIKAIQERIQSSPVGEGIYNELTRDYQIAKERYDDLTLKLKQSEMANQMEANFQGETLEIIEPPFPPQKPVEPNRFVIVGAGTGIGLMLGLFLAGAREAKDTSLKNLKDVRAYAKIPVLSTIPLLENAVLVKRKRRLTWLAWSTAMIVGVLIMSSSIYYYYFVLQRSASGS